MTVTPDEVKARIEAGIPGAIASVTGDGHHFNAVVSAPAFSGLPRLAQHRLVYDVFGADADVLALSGPAAAEWRAGAWSTSVLARGDCHREALAGLGSEAASQRVSESDPTQR